MAAGPVQVAIMSSDITNIDWARAVPASQADVFPARLAIKSMVQGCLVAHSCSVCSQCSVHCAHAESLAVQMENETGGLELLDSLAPETWLRLKTRYTRSERQHKGTNTPSLQAA